MAGSPRARKTGDQFFAAAAVDSPPAWGATANDAPTATPAGDHRHRGRHPQPLRERDDPGGDEERRRHQREQLADAERRHEPERGHERADDAPAGRHREEPPGRAPELGDLGRAQPHGDRGHRGEQDARHAEEQDHRDDGIEARPRIPAHDELEHAVVEHGNQQHADRAEQDHAYQQRRAGRAVGDRAANGVADRQAGENDADHRAPDVQRVAEHRRENAARRDLDSEQDTARDEDGDRDRRRPRSPPTDGNAGSAHPAKGSQRRRDGRERGRCKTVPFVAERTVRVPRRGGRLSSGLMVVAAAAACAAAVAAAAPSTAPVIKLPTKMFGNILSRRDHQALYFWTVEKKADGKIRCTGSCAKLWPPLVVKTAAAVPKQVAGIKGAFGVIRRPGGALQVTFKGLPVYTYVHEGPDEVLCDNVDGWFVVRL